MLEDAKNSIAGPTLEYHGLPLYCRNQIQPPTPTPTPTPTLTSSHRRNRTCGGRLPHGLRLRTPDWGSPPCRTWPWTISGTCLRRGTRGCSRRCGPSWHSLRWRASLPTATGQRSSERRSRSWPPCFSCSPLSSSRPSPFAPSPPSSASTGTGNCRRKQLSSLVSSFVVLFLRI